MELPVGCRRTSPISLVQLSKLYLSQQFSDYTIRLSDRILPVHKVILSSASRYFSHLFSNEFKESGSEIVFQDDPNLFELLIKTVYGFSLRIEEFPSQIGILRLAKFYQFYMPLDRLLVYLNQIEVPAGGFKDYVEVVEYIYDGLTIPLVEMIAQKLTPESDLHEISDEFLHLILSSKHFPTSAFTNEGQVYQFIHDIVSLNGNDEYYRYVKFRNLTPDQLVEIDPEVVEKFYDSSIRYALTENLTDFLREQANRLITEPIKVIVADDLQVITETKVATSLLGDGDQNKVKAFLKRNSTLKRGDCVEIVNYEVVDIPGRFYLVANVWNKL